MRRVLMLAAAVAIPVSALSVGLVAGGQAWAKAPKLNGKVTCTTITGNDASTIVVSGCSNSGSATASSSTDPINALSLEEGGTVEWTNGVTVTFSAPTLASTSAKHCPTAGSSAEKFSGTVTSSTAGLKVPGTFKGSVCVSPSGAVTAAKPLKTS